MMTTAYLVELEAVFDPVSKKLEGLNVLLRTVGLRLVYDRASLFVNVLGFIPEDELCAVIPSLQEELCNLIELSASITSRCV